MTDGGRSKQYSSSLLHIAAELGAPITLLEKLINTNIDVNSFGIQDSTPLHLASEGGHTDVVKFLLARGASINELDFVGNFIRWEQERDTNPSAESNDGPSFGF